jgi:hypothetical protein
VSPDNDDQSEEEIEPEMESLRQSGEADAERDWPC